MEDLSGLGGSVFKQFRGPDSNFDKKSQDLSKFIEFHYYPCLGSCAGPFLFRVDDWAL